MSFQQQNTLRYYTFESLQFPEVVQGIFTRNGGVSPAPWASLNLGGTVGDTRANVIENRRRIFELIQRPVETIFDSWQVHGDYVLITNRPRPLDEPHTKADAIVTNRPEVTLLMRFADCVPILFYDPAHAVVGIAHAGWQGTVKKIAAAVIRTMAEAYGSQPEEVIAGIGPSIGPDHYEVGEDVIARVWQSFGADAPEVLIHANGRVKFDLWKANRLVLEQAGVRQIEVAGLCTACHNHDWYSHRKEAGRTGRFAAVIALKSQSGG